VNYSDRGLLRGAVTVTVEGRLRDLGPAMEALERAGKRAGGVAQEPAPTVFLTAELPGQRGGSPARSARAPLDVSEGACPSCRHCPRSSPWI
jgi:hypothetical protein